MYGVQLRSDQNPGIKEERKHKKTIEEELIYSEEENTMCEADREVYANLSRANKAAKALICLHTTKLTMISLMCESVDFKPI